MRLGHRLRHARKKRGLKQDKLATIASTPEAPISQAAISALEQRNSETTTYLFALARALKINPEWLQDGKGDSGLDSDAWEPPMSTTHGLELKLEEAEAMKRLQNALPGWRLYVLGLAMEESKAAQQLLLDTMRKAVPDKRVEEFVQVAPHAAARKRAKEKK